MDHVRHAVQEFVETVREASVEIDKTARAAKVAGIRTKIAKNDRSFAQFMGNVLPEKIWNFPGFPDNPALSRA